MSAPFRLTNGEGLLLTIVGCRQMVDTGNQRTELFAVVDDAAHRNAAEPDAMIAAFAADQPDARRVAPHIMIGQRDLERGINCFGAGIAEENMVEIAGSQCGDTARQLEGLGVRELERRRVVERRRFALDGDNDLLAVVPGIGAPEARRAIDELAPVAGAVMHILGADDEPRPFLECAIGRERHPVGFEVIGDSDFCLCLCHGLSPLVRRHARPCAGHPRLPYS